MNPQFEEIQRLLYELNDAGSESGLSPENIAESINNQLKTLLELDNSAVMLSQVNELLFTGKDPPSLLTFLETNVKNMDYNKDKAYYMCREVLIFIYIYTP